MEGVLEEALKGFASDILTSDRPGSELSLKIFLIFKNIVGSHDHIKEDQIFRLVKTYLTNLPELKEQLAQQDSPSKCIQILRGQILIRLFFIWVARDCLKKDIDNDPGLSNITDEIIKLCEMFCIRTEPLQLNAFLSDTIMRMFVEYVPDILATIFDYFLLPLPKELASAAGNEENFGDHSPQLDSSSKEPSFDEPSNNKRRSREGRNSQPRHFVMSPIKSFDNNSSAGRNNRFGNRPSRQILVASRSSASDNNRGGKSGSKSQLISSSDRRVGVRSQSFDHVGVRLRQAATALQRQTTAPAVAESPAQPPVRRALFGEPKPPQTNQPRVGYTTPRKRSAAVLASVADTPPIGKQSKMTPTTPLSKNQAMEQLQKSPVVSSPFSKPMTTPLRQLQQQQLVARSPLAPGTILVPQSPDDSKAGIAARSFYTKPVALPQSIVQAASRKNLLTNCNRRTMSSYDFGFSTQTTVQPNGDTTHFLFTELVTLSPSAVGNQNSNDFPSQLYGCFPPPEFDMSPRTCQGPPLVLSGEKSQQHQSVILGSPVIESRSSRRNPQQQPKSQVIGSPFSVAAGYTCE